ncbi:hypothetical protein [Amphibacillus xylanus]|uniref:Methyl-accepting chemotaxis protein n=1 Tax=Amphibacillus xylanus (strain ATCC 51415 / DSM 6626 / JCM 7361 / LMG 17667 / NBRC 15112 / Ep01) TaxID=698758 RepID=K0J828_AMPXN|nr:hypothetical protein [Amphibacillus xylanus]BAM48393.1 methyl-accepting chemotaxis protein [Amphibacillus xylanus NBRC 15112]
MKKKNWNRFNLNNLSIAWKYGLILITIFILLITATTFVSKAINQTNQDLDILNRDSDRALLINELNDLIQSKALSVMGYAQFGSQIYIDDIEVKDQEIAEQVDKLTTQMTSDEQSNLLNVITLLNKQLSEMLY